MPITCPSGYAGRPHGPYDINCARYLLFPQEYSCPEGTTLDDFGYCDPVMTTTYTCAAGTLDAARNVCQQAPLPPSSKEQCKNGGYTNYGTLYRNQGACVSAMVSVRR